MATKNTSKPFQLQAPVRLLGGVRRAFAAPTGGADPGEVYLPEEDDAAAAGRVEVLESEIEQQLRGNVSPSDGRDIYDLVEEFQEDEDAPDAEGMTEDELNTVIERELSDSIGSDSDEVQGDRAKALDYYFGKPRGDEKMGRSKLQSLDVADMVESVLAQVMPAFTSDLAVEFECLSQDPMRVNQAKEESLAVDHVVQKENRGYTTLYKAIKDALLLKNGVVKVYLDEAYKVEIQELENATPQMLMLNMQPRVPGERVVVDSVDPDTGTVVIKRVSRKRKVRVEAVPPDEIRVNSDHCSESLEDARFACHDRIMREKELTAMGFDADMVADLPSAGSRTDTVHNARAQASKEEDTDTSDPENRPIRIYECWMLIDYDGDGIAERRKVMRAEDGTVLENVPINYMGLVSGSAYINPHKWVGISLFDKLKEIQDFKVHMIRQAADNANVANNARVGYLKNQVNEDQLFNSKPGGGVAMKRPDAIFPINTPDVIPSIFSMLEYGDKMRTERAGASLDMQSQQVPLQNRTAHGAERVISSMEQITALMAQTLAMTLVRSMYLTVHKLLREYFPQGYAFPHKGNMRQATPGQWPPRDNVQLTLGLSIGERMKQMGALQGVMAQQQEMLKAGKTELVTNQNLYNTVVDFARLAGLPNASQYWVDPVSQEGMMLAQQKQQSQQAAQQAQQEQQNTIIQLQKQVIEMQEMTKRMGDQLEAETKMAKVVEDRRQHGEDVAVELTDMELKYQEDVPGSSI